MSKKINTLDFINAAGKIHGNYYDYSLSVYRGNRSKIKIICPVHGLFIQDPHNHKKGSGCPKCGNLKIADKKKMSLNDFIIKAMKIHSDIYDYSLSVYVNSYTKLIVLCPLHGEFKQTPSNHLNGQGCPLCGNAIVSHKLIYKKEVFITKSDKIHCGKYDYSLVNYTGIFKKIEIICPIHGKFEQIAHNHLQGRGCQQCKKEAIKKARSLGYDMFIKKVRLIHKDKYRYSNKTYLDTRHKIEIICPKHGPFYQTPDKHMQGQGCTQCKIEEGSYKIKDTKESFINKALKIHGSRYDYSKTEYENSWTKILIICPKHGSFTQTPESHLVGRGCPRCSEPFGEKLIDKYLQPYKIKYIRQKKFKDCKDKRSLSFDFFIPIINTCIEYDGIQHFSPLDCFGGKIGFESNKKRDFLKTTYCKNNGINLVRIPYYMPKQKIRDVISGLFQEKFEELKAGGLRDLTGVKEGMLANIPVG